MYEMWWKRDQRGGLHRSGKDRQLEVYSVRKIARRQSRKAAKPESKRLCGSDALWKPLTQTKRRKSDDDDLHRPEERRDSVS